MEGLGWADFHAGSFVIPKSLLDRLCFLFLLSVLHGRRKEGHSIHIYPNACQWTSGFGPLDLLQTSYRKVNHSIEQEPAPHVYSEVKGRP